MKIMLLGKNGQIGWELRRALAPLGEVAALGRKELNLEDGAAIRETVGRVKPQIIVNAAAYTAVDRAEQETRQARLVNTVAPGLLAEEARRHQALLIHYSTDYIFDGAKKAPYNEDDETNPLNVYGQTKLEGEQNILAVGGSNLILRTGWIYGTRGKNFLTTMLGLARARKELRVVDDQVGSPTWCRLVAGATALVIARRKTGREEASSGIYHLSSTGQTSWHGFAEAIFARCFTPQKGCLKVAPLSSGEYQTEARRPLYSVLCSEKILRHYGLLLPPWEEALALALENNSPGAIV